MLYFPVLFSTHSIRLDGTVLDQGEGGAGVSFTLTPGDHLLTVETASDRGYYSGMSWQDQKIDQTISKTQRTF